MTLIPLRTDIAACDHCGVCCRSAPCLIGSPKEAEAIAAYLGGEISLSVEKTPQGRWLVRVSPFGKPCKFWNGMCALQAVKPLGGREFKCWDAGTYKKTYYWTESQIRKLGLAA